MVGKAIAAGVGIIVILLLLATAYLHWGTRSDATIYAPGFSDSKFRRIEKGMSRAEVQSILGKPLTHIEWLMEDESKWYYAFLDSAKIPHDDRVTNTWYKVRVVDFDGAGRVVRTVRSAQQFE